jgi:DnaJ family protein A protein 2
MYDQYGEAAVNGQGGGGAGMDMNDIFSQMFRGHQKQQQRRPRKGTTVERALRVTLEELYAAVSPRPPRGTVARALDCQCRGASSGFTRAAQEGAERELRLHREIVDQVRLKHVHGCIVRA